jgi:hypothetical protein
MMMTELYPAPPGAMMAGSAVSFILIWALLIAFSRLLGAPGLARDKTVTIVGMIFIAVFVVTDAVISTQIGEVWRDFAATFVLVTLLGVAVVWGLGQVPMMRQG